MAAHGRSMWSLKVSRDRAVITLAKLVRSAVWRRAWRVILCPGKGLGFTSATSAPDVAAPSSDA